MYVSFLEPIFGTAGTKEVSFASIAAPSGDNKAFSKKDDFKGFQGAGQQLFGVGLMNNALDCSVF